MELEPRVLALIAVGASVSANCQPCLNRNVRTALRCGATADQIAEAIDVGRRVRRGAATKMDEFAKGLDPASPVYAQTTHTGCDCSG